jgi:GxxExxY protein
MRPGILWASHCLDTDDTDYTDYTDYTAMLHDTITKQVIDAFYAVYHELGYGFLEAVYTSALVAELDYQHIKSRRQTPAEILYRGKEIGTYYMDLLVEGKVLVEVKSTAKLVPADERQLLNYLKATSIEVGLLLHFGPEPTVMRRILTNDRKHKGLAV